MHDNAIASVAAKVEVCLKQCELERTWPVYESHKDHVDSLAKEVMKHKKEWLSRFDVGTIVYNFIDESLAEYRFEVDVNGKLWEFLGQHKGTQLKDSIVDFLVSIPREYKIYMQLHINSWPSSNNLLQEFSAFEFTDKFSIAVFDHEDAPRGFSGEKPLQQGAGTKPPLKEAFFCYRTEGYCEKHLHSITVQNAYSKFKIAIQQCVAKRIWIAGGRLFNYREIESFYHIPKDKLVSVEQNVDEDVNANVVIDLPYEVSRFISSFLISASSPQVIRTDILKEHLRLPAMLMEDKTPEAVRIKSAIGWCFDSYASQSRTMVFLQICFGFESLFGDDESYSSFTNVLADRCAYIIGSKIKDRKVIRERFSILYKIRSKLVHGATTSLDSSEFPHIYWGRTVLEKAIFAEIQNLYNPSIDLFDDV